MKTVTEYRFELSSKQLPLTKSLAKQIGNAVFSYHVVDMSTSRHNTSSLLQERSDASNSFVGAGRNSNDGSTVWAERRSSNKVNLSISCLLVVVFIGMMVLVAYLTTDTAKHSATDGIRDNLSSEVNFNTAVDSCHLGLLGHNRRVIHVGNIQEVHNWIIIDKVVEA